MNKISIRVAFKRSNMNKISIRFIARTIRRAGQFAANLDTGVSALAADMTACPTKNISQFLKELAEALEILSA